MTNIDLLFQKCKIAHFHGWKDADLETCMEILPQLSLEELRMLNKSRWMDKNDPLYPTLFALLYKDQLEEVVRKLNCMTNQELLTELKETKSSYKKERIPEILYQRYDSMDKMERKKVFSLLVRKGLLSKA